MARAPLGFGSPGPITLPLSADPRIFFARLTPPCHLQLSSTDVLCAGHLQHPGTYGAALNSGYIKASHNILPGTPCGGFDSATHCFAGCPLGSHQKPPQLQNEHPVGLLTAMTVNEPHWKRTAAASKGLGGWMCESTLQALPCEQDNPVAPSSQGKLKNCL